MSTIARSSVVKPAPRPDVTASDRSQLPRPQRRGRCEGRFALPACWREVSPPDVC